ncbi:MAG TPA: 2,3-bisphosphoglycerate-independent phosphoglycerate mutase [Dongiaceae bacterium]|jgi:2,3-bisphosphoglycerate-independent phosphoglycerate mutase|nr:2,3-bisphosphoglycerate-independent phosphoglycerate mutase [Dongiaceae bacterium]
MTNPSKRPKPIVLCILDGWGHRPQHDNNAIEQAKTPAWHAMIAECPHALIDASELHVGLPEGQMGNSEVGHMNLGAGRVVMQDLPRIDLAVANGKLASNPLLHDFIGKLKQSKGTCHLMGLLSPGGVHSHQVHLIALAKAVSGAGVPVALHAFLDGRDTPPSSGKQYVAEVAAALSGLANVRFGTVGGRYFAMDRDKRWERVELAYNAFFGDAPYKAPNAVAAVEAAYAREETDEFVKPTLIEGFAGIKDGDGLLMGNFRADRARQMLTTLLDPAFDGFARRRIAKFAATLGLVEYSTALAKFMPALFPPAELSDTLGEIASKAGMKQLRIAETEKYAHVTFFFNGGEERLFPGEERILVPSPKVATYDLKPEMSAYEVTDKLVAAIEADTFDLIVVNFANTDMVGHSGNLAAAIKAVEAVDRCLGRLRKAVEAKGGAILITADHGNAEMMKDPVTGEPHTAHTLNRVPVIVVGAAGRKVIDGKLADVAPTLLELMGLPKPAAMTGHSLLAPREDTRARATA